MPPKDVQFPDFPAQVQIDCAPALVDAEYDQPPAFAQTLPPGQKGFSLTAGFQKDVRAPASRQVHHHLAQVASFRVWDEIGTKTQSRRALGCQGSQGSTIAATSSR